MIKYRADIDGLRAIAVLMVVIYHFKKNIGFNGYMGVDIFFVISGFLITKIIYNEIDRGSFSLRDFYERRIKRIIPVLLTVIGATTLTAYFLFLPPELLAYAKSAIASLFFSSNILFYTEAGYFDAEADLKPLLHTWSLAVEEQFYIVFPLLLFALHKWVKFNIKYVLAGLTVLSLLAGLIIAQYDKSAAFYLFPLRAWELLIGALLAVWVIPQNDKNYKKLNVFSIVGLGLITLGVSLDIDHREYYNLHLLPVVLGTAMIIYAGAANGSLWVNRALSIKPMVFLGKISYSLYLWHWPVYVFAQYYSFNQIEKPEKASLILLCIGLSYLSWRFIEQPFRKKEVNIFSVKNLGIGALFITFILGTSIFVISQKGHAFWHDKDILKYTDVKIGMSLPSIALFDSDKKQRRMGAGEKEDSTDKITTLLIGDSHARAITPSIDAQLKKYNLHGAFVVDECFIPLKFQEQFSDSDMKECSDNSGKIIHYIQNTPQIDTVIMAQRFVSRTANWHYNYGVTHEKYLELRRDSLLDFVKSIEALNRKIVIVAQVPLIDIKTQNVPSIYVRMKMLGSDQIDTLNPTQKGHKEHQGKIAPILKYVENNSTAEILWPEEYLCPQEKCDILDDEGFYYYDDDHLSRYGATKFSYIFTPYFKN